VKWLLFVYPPAWRRRYQREVARHLEVEPPSFRTALDLVAGAVDAWLNPGWIPDVATPDEERDMIRAARCGSADISKPEALRSAAWMLVITFILTAIGVLLDKTYGDHVMSEALIYSSFFIGFTWSSRNTYLKPYSPRARNVILAVSTVGWYGFFLATGMLSAL